MRPVRFGILSALLFGLAFGAAPRLLPAQAADSALTEGTVATLAKAHLAMVALRDQAHAALADQRNKKAEVQAELREKLLTDSRSLLARFNLTEAEYQRLIRRVSVENGSRKTFEAELARQAGIKPAS